MKTTMAILVFAAFLSLATAANLRLHDKPAVVASPASSTCAFLQAAVSAEAQAQAKGDHKCPVEYAKGQAGYFDKLHTSLVKGSGPLQGCLDKSSQEYYVNFFKDELACLHATIVEDKCG